MPSPSSVPVRGSERCEATEGRPRSDRPTLPGVERECRTDERSIESGEEAPTGPWPLAPPGVEGASMPDRAERADRAERMERAERAERAGVTGTTDEPAGDETADCERASEPRGDEAADMVSGSVRANGGYGT